MKAIKNLVIILGLQLLAVQYAICCRMGSNTRSRALHRISQRGMHLRTKLGFAYQIGAKTVWIPRCFRKQANIEMDTSTAETIHNLIAKKRAEKTTQE